MTKKDPAVEELPGYLRPVYDEERETAEGLKKYEMCGNCNLARYEHGPGGECLFDSTKFVVKITRRVPRMHPTKAHADAADPNEE